jgi:biotin--protein ligase
MTLSFTMQAQQNILIYSGPGAGPKSLANTVALLQQLVTDKYVVKTIGPDEVIDPAWLDNTALFVMPGGADRPYLEKLKGAGNANIRRYVENGGKFLGICAGAYYSADRIEFAKGDQDLEVSGVRELKFFPDLVEGPTYAGFDHRNASDPTGMRAATIYWQAIEPFKRQAFVVFYNGGGHFVNAEKYSNVVILARYAREAPSRQDQPAAIVECSFGQGKAILSGAHFEWHADTLELNGDLRLENIKAKLAKSDKQRMQLAQHLLSRLDIATR